MAESKEKAKGKSKTKERKYGIKKFEIYDCKAVKAVIKARYVRLTAVLRPLTGLRLLRRFPRLCFLWLKGPNYIRLPATVSRYQPSQGSGGWTGLSGRSISIRR